MKALIFALALSVSFAQAATIKSMNECKVGLYTKTWKDTFTLEGSRVEGKIAQKISSVLLSRGASSQIVTDVLGVARYSVIQSQSVLDQVGTDVNSCEGVYTASEVVTCTVDPMTSVCETSCSIKWQGMDCR